MKKYSTYIATILLMFFSTATVAEDGSCAEMYQHIENYKRTESFLMVDKFNRDGSVTPTEKDGRLWEMWQKLQKLKKEKEADIEKYCR